MSAIIEFEHVTKNYDGVVALKDASLKVEAGESVTIVGPSGSGKSTLLQLIGTLDRPSSGTIRVDGYDLATLSDNQLSALRSQRIGFVFQQFHLAAGISALDNVADGLLYQGVEQSERRERAKSALDRVGLGTRIYHRPHELSGGERQRVAIARATVGTPRILLADEPTGNLDTVSGAGVLKVLSDLNAAGTTVLVITHDIEVAETFERKISIRDGHVTQ